MNRRLAPGLTIARSRIHGKGCFAAILFRQNQQIAEYVGERTLWRKLRAEDAPPARNASAMLAPNGPLTDAGAATAQYVNHSCQPNSQMIVLRGQIFLFALKEITPGEKITTDYLYELGLDGTRYNCRTGSCRKRISHAGITEDSAGQASETPDRQISKLWRSSLRR